MREAPMRKVNPAAKRVLDELTMGLAHVGDHRKLDNAKGAFMPVSVEIIDTGRDGYVWVSVAHYGEQNGDLMRDPEMIFVKAPLSGDYFPTYWRNDYIGKEIESVTSTSVVNGTRFFEFNDRMQADQAVFANTWLRNIRHQQRLFEKRTPAARQLPLEVTHV